MNAEPSSEVSPENIRELVLKHALANAVAHGGKASPGAVMGKVIAERPELRIHARRIAEIVAQVVREVNAMSVEEQRRIVEERWPELLGRRKVRSEEKLELPPLPNAVPGHVKTRFAPNPDFVLHIGNARPAVLSYEYASMYKGSMVLRFEDTDPRTKRPLPESYRAIKEDLRWLGIKWDEEYVQSLRMSIYYRIAAELIRRGGAYVDTCSSNEFNKYRIAGKPCPHRERSVEEQLEDWDKMLSGNYGEGEAVLRVKTDLHYPDPSVRDWVAFRIIDTSRTPHPLVGDKYSVWPTYNFAAAVDDHLMGVTHILRGKEHATNTVKQKFLYSHLGWRYPETVHFGRLRLEGFMMSKSRIRELLESRPGEYEGFSDPRFGTLAALRARGFLPEAIRRIILHVGVKGVDATISFENLAAMNRKILDPLADRYMFVSNPVKLVVENMPPSLEARIPYHPSKPEKGGRRLLVHAGEPIYISSNDKRLFESHKLVRLMELGNVTPIEIGENIVVCRFHSRSLEEARRHNAPIVQWVPENSSIPVVVKKPAGDRLLRIRGLGEHHLAKLAPGAQIQFLRFGFVKLSSIRSDIIEAYYTHP